jgi:hypothetical protein
MLALAAVMILSQSSMPRPSATAVGQARAIVRIVSAARIRFDAAGSANAPLPHDTRVRDRGPALLPAKLVEFE